MTCIWFSTFNFKTLPHFQAFSQSKTILLSQKINSAGINDVDAFNEDTLTFELQLIEIPTNDNQFIKLLNSELCTVYPPSSFFQTIIS